MNKKYKSETFSLGSAAYEYWLAVVGFCVRINVYVKMYDVSVELSGSNQCKLSFVIEALSLISSFLLGHYCASPRLVLE